MVGWEFALISAIEAGLISALGFLNARKAAKENSSFENWDWGKFLYTIGMAVFLGFVASFGTDNALAAGSTGALAQVLVHQGMKNKDIKLV